MIWTNKLECLYKKSFHLPSLIFADKAKKFKLVFYLTYSSKLVLVYKYYTKRHWQTL